MSVCTGTPAYSDEEPTSGWYPGMRVFISLCVCMSRLGDSQVCMCLSICVCVCVCIQERPHTATKSRHLGDSQVCMCLSVCVCMYRSMTKSRCLADSQVCMCFSICVCMCASICVSMCACMLYIHIYIYRSESAIKQAPGSPMSCMYTYIHTCTYTQTGRNRDCRKCH